MLAILFTYAHRDSRVLPPIAVFNALILGAIPSEGRHYLAEVLGGVVVGGLAISITHALPVRIPAPAPRRPADSAMPSPLDY